MTVQATEAPLMPLGPARVRIARIEEGLRSEHQGTPYLNVHLEGVGGDAAGTALEQRLYLSEAAQPILATFINGLGLDASAEHDPQDFVGRELLVDIAERSYDAPDTGQPRTIREAEHFRAVED